MKSIQIQPSADILAKAAAESVIEIGADSIRSRGNYSIALSGGSTPLALFRILAGKDYDKRLDWGKVDFFWGDERTVPPDHEDSNYFQAAQELLRPRSIDPDRIHRIQGEIEPVQAARSYQEDLQNYFGSSRPRLDLILLGLGSDSHTASLFPGTDLVTNPGINSDLLVGANWVPKLESWRISFTHQLINLARNVLFLVSGEGKAAALRNVLEGDDLPGSYPAQLIRPVDGKLIWLVDEEAASQLTDLKHT